MSFAIPNADKYISYQRISDLQNLQYGWVVVAVLETECQTTVYLNNGEQGYGPLKSVEFLVGLQGSREQADILAEKERAVAAAALVLSDFDKAKNYWEETEKKLQKRVNDTSENLASSRARCDLLVKEKEDALRQIGQLKDEITRWKDNVSTVMLLVADNQKMSVADLIEAKKVAETFPDGGSKMGAE